MLTKGKLKFFKWEDKLIRDNATNLRGLNETKWYSISSDLISDEINIEIITK